MSQYGRDYGKPNAPPVMACLGCTSFKVAFTSPFGPVHQRAWSASGSQEVICYDEWKDMLLTAQRPVNLGEVIENSGI
jgi:hypothetical protein